VITVEAARLRQQEKAEKEKAAALKNQKSIQIPVNKAKATLNRRGINAPKAAKERKKQVIAIQAKGEIVLPEMQIAIPDPERNPSAEDLESLQPPRDLLQALSMLNPTATSTACAIDPQLFVLDSEASDVEIYTARREAEARHTMEQDRRGNSFTVDNGETFPEESDSDSSSISADSIMRNADFVTLN